MPTVSVKVAGCGKGLVGPRDLSLPENSTVADLVRWLTDEGLLHRSNLSPEKALAGFLIILNHVNIHSLQGASTVLQEGDTVMVLPAMAGG